MSNITYEDLDNEFSSFNQYRFYEFSKWLNVILISLISILGVYGNLISIYIFTKTLKLNRNQKSTIYFLVLSFSDLFVLIFHYLDFTFRSWINLTGNYSSNFNFVDKCLLCCKLIPYFRNFFRTISVYTLLIMTLQRFIYLYLPLKRAMVSSLKTNKTIIVVLVILSLLLNSGNLFVNTLTKHETNGELYCNINPDYVNLQFVFDFLFALFSVLIPTLFIFFFSLILFCRIKSNIPLGNDFFQISCCKQKNFDELRNQSQYFQNTFDIANSRHKNIDLEPKGIEKHVTFDEQYTKRSISSRNSSKKMPKFKTKFNHSIRTTYMLVLLSKWFVILHLPYFICWIILHFQIKNANLESTKYIELSSRSNHTSFYNDLYMSEIIGTYNSQLDHNQNITLMIKGFLNLFEILFLSNYSLHFLLYLFNGPIFREKHSRICYKFLENCIFNLFCGFKYC